MPCANTHILDVPGAHLRYELHGSGPVLLLIPGAWGDADMLAGLVPFLADDYTVVTYDPRGLSHSTLDGPAQDVTVEAQAEDAHRLLSAITAERAYVFGASSGAITGLMLVTFCPDQVHTLVAHEPPIIELLPDSARLHAWVDEVCNIHRTDGAVPAMTAFLAGAGLGDSPDEGEPQTEPDPETRAALARMRDNLDAYFGHMFRPTAGYRPDAATLRAASTRVVVAGGAESTGQLSHRAAVALADLLGTTIVDLPGDHGGYFDQPVPFAKALHRLFVGMTPATESR